MRTGLSITTGFFLKKNNDDGKYIHCFLPYIVIVGIEPVANSFLFFLYNSITLLFLLKSKTDSTINPILTPHQFPLLVRTGLSIITGFFLQKNNDDGKYIHCFLPYIVIVGIEPVANSFLFFLYNSITLLFLLKSKTDSTINPNSQTLVIYHIREKLLKCHKKWDYPSLTPHQFPLLVRTGLSITTGFFLKKNNDDGKYIHCFLPYIVIVGIEPVANSFLFFLYNSITLLFLLKSKTDSTINPILTPHQFPLLVRTGLSIITGFFLQKNNDDGKYIHCFLPYIVIVGIEPVANSFLFFLYNSITLLFLLKSKTDSTINPNPKKRGEGEGESSRRRRGFVG